jgi:protein-S-isoprenylcysteine O-methyltransferase Ste14
MDKLDIYETIVFSIFILWGVSELILLIKRRARSNSKKIKDWTLAVQFAGITISITVGLVLKFTCSTIPTGVFNFGDNLFMLCCAIVFFLIGIIIRWHAILKLKQWFSTTITIKEGHQIMSKGIYKFVRHPSYLGVVLCFIGLALSFHTVVLFLIVFVPNLIALLIRISFEEKVLISHFGSDYIDYKNSTKKLLPLIF